MAKKSASTEPALEKPRKLSRMESAAMAVRNMTDQTTIEELVLAADARYAESGGRSDMHKSREWVGDVLRVAKALGLVEVSDVRTKTVNRTKS